MAHGEADDDKRMEIEEYNRAHELYVSSDFKEAIGMFQKLYKIYKKPLYEIYSQRCEHLIEIGMRDFDGVFEFTTK